MDDVVEDRRERKHSSRAEDTQDILHNHTADGARFTLQDESTCITEAGMATGNECRVCLLLHANAAHILLMRF